VSQEKLPLELTSNSLVITTKVSIVDFILAAGHPVESRSARVNYFDLCNQPRASHSGGTCRMNMDVTGGVWLGRHVLVLTVAGTASVCLQYGSYRRLGSNCSKGPAQAYYCTSFSTS
jgi:hypothetical protein